MKTTPSFTGTMLRGILLTLLLTLAFSARGQNDSMGYSIGLKVGTAMINGVFLEGIDINFFNNKWQATAGFNYNHDLLQIFQPEPREIYRQFYALFGSFVSSRKFRLEYQGGLGVVWGRKRTELKSRGFLSETYHTKPIATVGLPLRLGAKFVVLENLSIGIEILTNINPEKTYARPMFSFNFGKLR